MLKEVFTLGSRRYQSFGNFGFLRFFYENSCRIFGRPWASRNKASVCGDRETSFGFWQKRKIGIHIPPSEMLKLSEMLKETFRGEISTMVTDIITGVLQGLQDRISSLEKSNSEMRKENKSLTARVAVLESQADHAEQYSRRNCLRISGYHAQINENTDGSIPNIQHEIFYS